MATVSCEFIWLQNDIISLVLQKEKQKNKELRMMPEESEPQKNSAGKQSPVVSVVIC